MLIKGDIDLEVLTISRNRLEDKGASALAKALTGMKSIRRLEMFQNGVHSEAMAEIFVALRGHPNVRELKVNDNFIKEAGLELAESILKWKELETLDVSDNVLGNETTLEIFKSLLFGKKKGVS